MSLKEDCVITVLGPVAADDLGIVLPHEHLPLVWGDYQLNSTAEQFEPPEGYRSRLAQLEREALRDASGYGVKTLVEVTPIGMFRNPRLMQRLSRECGVHIIASTGFYVEGKMPTWVKDRTERELGDLLVRELTEGIADTGIRPWMIKIAGSGELQGEQEQKVFRAAAYASRRTGAAVTTHSCGGVRRHFDFLTAAGADPTRLYIGHADLVGDPEEYTHVARQGGHLIFTCWGIQHFVDQDLLAGRVAGLAEQGFASAVLISIDYALCFSTDRMLLVSFEYECPWRTHSFLFRYALPKLREKGVGEEVLQQFLVGNPRAMLIRPGRTDVASSVFVPAAKRKARLVRRTWSEAARAEFLSVANEHLAGWPYTRPLDDALMEYWATRPNFQPENIWIAYRDSQARAVLHGEIHQRAGVVHFLGTRSGAVEEGRWLLGEWEEKVRAAGLSCVHGPHWASGGFYAGYVLGQEQCIPSWDTDGTCAFVEAGYRMELRGVIMVYSLAQLVPEEPAPQGYEIVAVPREAEFGARPFGYHAVCDTQKAAHCYARLYPRLMAPRGGTVGQLGNVTTEAAHRGKGLARIMAKRCLRDLQRMGATEVLIATSLDNFPALRAYERAGFVRRYNMNFWTKAW